jgi:plastocyanin
MLKKRARFWLAMSLTLSLLAFSYACGGKKDDAGTGGDNTGGGGDTSSKAQEWTPKGDEGSITGKISLTGTAPAPSKIDTAQDANCAAKNPNLMTETVMAKDGKLQNVIVYIKDGTLADGKKLSDYSFKTPDTEVTLDQNGCHYVPHVIVMQANQKLKVVNSDQTNHNIHALPKSGGGNEEWNQSQGPGAAPLMETFKRPEIVPIKCNQHPWMKAYAGVFKHPFFAVSKDDGSYEIKGVPPGKYTVVAWQEKGPTESKPMEVTVTKGAATADFTFDASAMAAITGSNSSLEVVPAIELPMLGNH